MAILPPPIRTKKPRKQLLAGLAEEQRERLSVAIHFTVGVLLVIGLLALLVTGRLDAPSGPTYPPAGWSCLLAVECEAERPRKQCQSR